MVVEVMYLSNQKIVLPDRLAVSSEDRLLHVQRDHGVFQSLGIVQLKQGIILG